MRLSDVDLQSALKTGRIEITPCPTLDRIMGATIDLRLGHQFRTFKNESVPYIDLSANAKALERQLNMALNEEMRLEDSALFFLHPGELALAVTHECISLPQDLVGWLDGRSSLARLGLSIHITAHRVDPGWSGHIVLECYNTGKLPLALKPLMTIAALSIEPLSTPAQFPYRERKTAKYAYQSGATGSRFDAEAADE